MNLSLYDRSKICLYTRRNITNTSTFKCFFFFFYLIPGVTSSKSAQSAFVNPVISNNSVSSNTHIHINQPYFHHEADNFTIRQPVQKHLTIPGHSELRAQQTNITIPAATSSSSGNIHMDSHPNNNWQAHQNNLIRNGLNNQGSRSCNREIHLNSQATHNHSQQACFRSDRPNGQVTASLDTGQDQTHQKGFSNNNFSDQRFMGNLDARQKPTNNLLHNAKDDTFRENQINQPLNYSRKDLFSEHPIGNHLMHNTRQEQVSKDCCDNCEMSNASQLPGHHTGHVSLNTTAQQPYFYGDQRNGDMMYPGLPTHDSSKSMELWQPFSKVSPEKNKELFPSSFNVTSKEKNMANTQVNSHHNSTDYMPLSQSAVRTNSAPILSHDPLQDINDQISSHVDNGTLGGQFKEGLHYVDEESREDSLLIKSLSKDPLGTMRLRNRLEGIAMRQKNSAVWKAHTKTDKHSKGMLLLTKNNK